MSRSSPNRLTKLLLNLQSFEVSSVRYLRMVLENSGGTLARKDIISSFDCLNALTNSFR